MLASADAGSLPLETCRRGDWLQDNRVGNPYIWPEEHGCFLAAVAMKILSCSNRVRAHRDAMTEIVRLQHRVADQSAVGLAESPDAFAFHRPTHEHLTPPSEQFRLDSPYSLGCPSALVGFAARMYVKCTHIY
jgi:hypothetical protein